MNMKLLSSSSYERKRIAGFKKVNAFKDGLSILMNRFNLQTDDQGIIWCAT